MTSEKKESSGVQELIDRLHDEGVAKGQEEADGLRTEARKESMSLLDDARRQAEEILAQARAEAARVKESGNEALRQASRDVILKLKESFHDEFENKVRKLVAFELQDPKFLEQLILEIARKAVPADEGKPMRVLLPADMATEEELASNAADVQEGSLAHFVLGLSADVLREGLTFGVSEDAATGVCVRLVEDDVEIELTDETVTALLMQYMVPTFRAILEGGS
jgi:V/A-type H+-transporting ATPase subunit E